MAAAYHAVLSQLFKFMNVAPTAWQSGLMFRALLEQAEDTPFQALITNSPKRPYPQIEIQYMVGKKKFSSLLEFMTLGEGGNADNIFSYRGDWVNIDEAGKIDDLSTVVTNLVTRLTGGTAENRSYLGRLSLISNPWENPDLWMLYDMAEQDKEDGLIFNIDTKMNKNTTEKQVRFALKMIPKELHARFMSGAKPEGRGTYFSKADVDRCIDPEQSELFMREFEKGTPGYETESLSRLGTFYMKQPRKDGRLYFLLGDPGTGSAPARNAPCLICFDVTEAPQKSRVVGFWWGNGGGSITPFLDKIVDWIQHYKPIYVGVDNTGPQKSTAELITIDHIYGKGYSVNGVSGLDFSGAKRYSYLAALRLSLEAGMITWADILSGIGIQLKNYDPILDKVQNGKLAQDIVATMAMGAFAIRAYYGVFESQGSEEDDLNIRELIESRRHDRTELRGRTRVTESEETATLPR